MADAPEAELLGVYGLPITRFDSTEDSDALDPGTRSVGWALAWGCQLTFGMEGPGLTVTVSISDAEQKAGICKREVTPEQLREYARQIRELAHAHDQFHGRPKKWAPLIEVRDVVTPRVRSGRGDRL